MRISYLRGAVIGAVLLGPLLLADVAGAQSRRPIGGPVGAPTPPPPPVPVLGAEDEEKEESKGSSNAEKGGKAAPAAPPPPAVFKDAHELTAPAAAAEVEEEPIPLGPWAELRHIRRVGDRVYEVSVRPGKPQPGDLVDVIVSVQRLHSIPHPVYGDREPLREENLAVRVKGNGIDQLFTLHPLVAPGEYGAHFTAGGQGVHTLTVDSPVGKRGQRAEFAVGVGVETPKVGEIAKARTRARGRTVVEGVELVNMPRPDESTTAGMMRELGKKWMELQRKAGTPEATAAADAVREHAAGMRAFATGEDAVEFGQLAEKSLQALQALDGIVADPVRAEGAILGVQNEACLRCHVRFRFDLAESVQSWPDFAPNPNPKQPTKPAAVPAKATGRRPFGT